MIKKPSELALMTESGRLLAEVFRHLDQINLIGMSTMQVNDLADEFIVRTLGARPASKGQYGYEFALNSSRNHVVCHGVPSRSEVIKDGDIVNFDITLEKGGFIADSSKSYLVGAVSDEARKLVQTAHEAMWKGSVLFDQEPPWVMSGTRFRDMLGATAARSFGNTVDTESAGKCTRNLRCCITASPEPACACARVWSSPLSRCSTKGVRPFAPRTMDGPW